ncbi:MAG: leucine--tRNA ligase [Crocinitomicaceae bacterium]
MEYNFRQIEQDWRKFWAENKTFKAEDFSDKPKFYVLDMFPYPSGAGLHVGHPLGYIASDIFARYKRLQGFNVLHPMGYDSFGLPAEQYAIQTGQHPEKTTRENIARYRGQMDKIGFSFDWDREVRTSSPEYYKWTQWIFKQLFDCWYDKDANKAVRISELIAKFEAAGNANVNAEHDFEGTFTSEDWKAMSEKEQSSVLMSYRLTYLADSWVNWCAELGTVLANDEVVNGVSERGGHPVEQKLMRQWSMRIKAYAERLLTGLETIDWTDSIKDQQRNWIGKSQGASVQFELHGHHGSIEVFTTRPDTIYGVSFMVLAPEHPLVDKITKPAYADKVAEYKRQASLKSERDRQSDVKNITGQNTGAFAIHPFTQEKVQVWIADYVLASYGTGAVMAVPCGDQRDWDFAQHFGIDIINIFEGEDVSEGAYTEKDAVISNSDFLSGLPAKKAIKTAIYEIEKRGIGKGKTQYRLRDAVFSRQRYWGEPFPVFYKDEIPHLVPDADLPITLPEVDKYLPTEDGEPPLARAEKSAWNYQEGDRMEYNTMPGWAGSSWYFLRYMDPKNETEFVAKDKVEYWNNVDLYIGGSEHATGHLLYARFWTKFLYDLGYIPFEEPFQKMINQGMILGNSALITELKLEFDYWMDGIDGTDESHEEVGNEQMIYLSDGVSGVKREDVEDDLKEILMNAICQRNEIESVADWNIEITDWSKRLIHVDINLVGTQDHLDLEKVQEWRDEFKDALFVEEEEDVFKVRREVEKMSKRWYNVQTPDELCEDFGADTLRMYEMFLGPLEQSKPWDTKGISGVHNFLRKLWRLFHDKNNEVSLDMGDPSKDALKTLHKTIKKVGDDLERFSFNTGVSNFMICVNELTDQKCNNKHILEQLTILISPYAPHIAEELWVRLGNAAGTISQAQFPEFNEEHLVESSHDYPISFNGKMRFKLEFPLDMSKEQIEQEVLAHETAVKWLEGKDPKRVIVVPGKVVNIVV